MANNSSLGKVWLVGAGPGDYGLLTCKAREVIDNADTIVYDALVSLELLATLPENAELINVGKRSRNHLVPQEETNVILLEKAKEGKKVVRLKGGDPFVFGRGGEELELLVKEGVPFEVIPGITSAVSVPAYNGIPVTHRDYTSSFHVITGHKKKDGALDIDFDSLVKLDATLVFLMGISEMETICGRLIEAGMSPDMPAAVLERGTTFAQKRAIATVSTLKAESERVGIGTPAIIVVGRVCQLEKDFFWAEKRPLFGKQVLITRPRERKSVLAKKLRTLGAQVVEFPTIETSPIANAAAGVKELLDEQKKVCISFTSPRGVDYFFEQLKDAKIDVRKLLAKADLSFAVIGQGTEAALEKYGIFADIMPAKYSAEELGKELAAKFDKDGVVYLFRAKKASEALVRILDESKISYRDIAIYETNYRTENPVADKIAESIKSGEISEVMFTSASTVEGFAETFAALLSKEELAAVNAVCIGEQTAAEAQKHGMQIRISEAATIDSMIDVLLK